MSAPLKLAAFAKQLSASHPGNEISVGMLRRWIKADGMPHFFIGRRIYVNPEAFQTWLAEKERASKIEGGAA